MAQQKESKTEELTQDTPEEEEEEAEFVHTLSPKQKAEYDGLDKEQKALVKYVLGVPGVDVSKIDLIGNKQKESPAVSAPPLPSRREDAHSGSGRSFSPDTGIGTQVRSGADGTKKRRLEAGFRKETLSSEDWGTGFTHRSGSFSADASGSGTKPNTNGVVNFLQSLKDEDSWTEWTSLRNCCILTRGDNRELAFGDRAGIGASSRSIADAFS